MMMADRRRAEDLKTQLVEAAAEVSAAPPPHTAPPPLPPPPPVLPLEAVGRGNRATSPPAFVGCRKTRVDIE